MVRVRKSETSCPSSSLKPGIRCECTILVDYTEDLLLYMLVIGVTDLEMQENLLKL